MVETGTVWEGIARCPSGLYRIDAAQRGRIVHGAPMSPTIYVAVLDGAAVHDRVTFFAALASGLHFPDYFGRNWDAVYDCLTDPSWFPAGVVVLLLDGFAPLAAREPEQWQIALKVFQDACDFWQPLDWSLFALLYGVSGEAPGTEALPPTCLAADDDGA